jgi:hypothetical protein
MAQNLQPAGQNSFGTDNTTQPFRARNFLDGERYRELDRRQSYYDCNQHSYKRFDFDGRLISTGGGISVTQPLLSAERAAYYVPLRSRRPSSPYRLPRVIVNAFTGMVFGEGRFPNFRVEGDEDAEDYVKALVKAMKLPTQMIRARNLGGAMGTVGVSWCFLNGRPRCKVHNAKNLYVHEWEDRDDHIPSHVTEMFQYSNGDEWDPIKRRYVANMYWFRRDWTKNVDVVFLPVKVEPGKDPVWVPDASKSQDHRDNLIHFVWIQNKANDGIDGFPDYEGLYENFDTLDLLLSVIVRGATLNLDPTLKLKMDPDLVNRMGVRKGSDNALVVGKEGDAEYLELAGLSLKAGIELFNAKRRSVLEVARCVIPDPDEITANGTSSVAMKMLYAPMLGEADILREQYGEPIAERLLDPMITVARIASRSTIIIYDQDGNEKEVQQEIMLPPKTVSEPVTDEDTGAPTGETTTSQVDRNPGEGGEIEPEWGPYFSPTPADQMSLATTLSTATGGTEAFMSTQTATELMMVAFGRQAQDEATRVAGEAQVKQKQQADMLASNMGGQVGGPKQLPPGAKPKPGQPGKPGGKPGQPPPMKPPKPPKPPKPGGGGGGFGGPPDPKNDMG